MITLSGDSPLKYADCANIYSFYSNKTLITSQENGKKVNYRYTCNICKEHNIKDPKGQIKSISCAEGSTSNLSSHLNSELPGHQEAWKAYNALQEKKSKSYLNHINFKFI